MNHPFETPALKVSKCKHKGKPQETGSCHTDWQILIVIYCTTKVVSMLLKGLFTSVTFVKWSKISRLNIQLCSIQKNKYGYVNISVIYVIKNTNWTVKHFSNNTVRIAESFSPVYFFYNICLHLITIIFWTRDYKLWQVGYRKATERLTVFTEAHLRLFLNLRNFTAMQTQKPNPWLPCAFFCILELTLTCHVK